MTSPIRGPLALAVAVAWVISACAQEPRPDLYGDALNQLFKLPAGDFVISPALMRVIGGD